MQRSMLGGPCTTPRPPRRVRGRGAVSACAPAVQPAKRLRSPEGDDPDGRIGQGDLRLVVHVSTVDQPAMRLQRIPSVGAHLRPVSARCRGDAPHSAPRSCSCLRSCLLGPSARLREAKSTARASLSAARERALPAHTPGRRTCTSSPSVCAGCVLAAPHDPVAVGPAARSSLAVPARREEGKSQTKRQTKRQTKYGDQEADTLRLRHGRYCRCAQTLSGRYRVLVARWNERATHSPGGGTMFCETTDGLIATPGACTRR